MSPHSSTFAWKIPRTEEPGGLLSMGSLESDTTERLHFHFSLSCIGEGNGNPLQCSCLENPRDWEAWWAAVYGVPQSRTRLKRLSSSSSRLHWELFRSIFQYIISAYCQWHKDRGKQKYVQKSTRKLCCRVVGVWMVSLYSSFFPQLTCLIFQSECKKQLIVHLFKT